MFVRWREGKTGVLAGYLVRSAWVDGKPKHVSTIPLLKRFRPSDDPAARQEAWAQADEALDRLDLPDRVRIERLIELRIKRPTAAELARLRAERDAREGRRTLSPEQRLAVMLWLNRPSVILLPDLSSVAAKLSV